MKPSKSLLKLVHMMVATYKCRNCFICYASLHGSEIFSFLDLQFNFIFIYSYYWLHAYCFSSNCASTVIRKMNSTIIFLVFCMVLLLMHQVMTNCFIYSVRDEISVLCSISVGILNMEASRFLELNINALMQTNCYYFYPNNAPMYGSRL